MTRTRALFEARHLRVTYPASRRAALTAVHDVSFTLDPGRILAIVGESGCGKSSLARAILGLADAPPGSLYFRGQDLTAMSPPERRAARRAIQHVLQDPAASLSPRRTVRQSLEEPLALYRIAPRCDWTARIARALETVALGPEVLHRFPHELSGGQRQRISLARALIAEPALIVADEPMSALDVSAQARIIGLIRRVRDELGIAILLISHDLAVVQQLADEVGVMYLGRLVEYAHTPTLFRAPAHPYTQALLSAALSGRGERPLPLPGEPPSPLTPPPGCVFHTRCPRVTARCAREVPVETFLRCGDGAPTAHQVRCLLYS